MAFLAEDGLVKISRNTMRQDTKNLTPATNQVADPRSCRAVPHS